MEFKLTNEENKKANAFIFKHNDMHKRKITCAYTFIPGDFGTRILIECKECGEIEDISDYIYW